jgi:hypothetical protein
MRLISGANSPIFISCAFLSYRAHAKHNNHSFFVIPAFPHDMRFLRKLFARAGMTKGDNGMTILYVIPATERQYASPPSFPRRRESKKEYSQINKDNMKRIDIL